MLLLYLYNMPTVPERLVNHLLILSVAESRVKMVGYIWSFRNALEKLGTKYQTPVTVRHHCCEVADLDPLAMELEMMLQNLEKMEAFGTAGRSRV